MHAWPTATVDATDVVVVDVGVEVETAAHTKNEL